jgi:hypothetical protein
MSAEGMHSSKHRDPLISRAEPVTIITPVVDETLRMAGVPSVREQIIDRFMNGQPRIAVVHGSEDHPPNLGARETTSSDGERPTSKRLLNPRNIKVLLPTIVRDFFGRGSVLFALNLPVISSSRFQVRTTSTGHGEFQSEL